MTEAQKDDLTWGILGGLLTTAVAAGAGFTAFVAALSCALSESPTDTPGICAGPWVDLLLVPPFVAFVGSVVAALARSPKIYFASLAFAAVGGGLPWLVP